MKKNKIISIMLAFFIIPILIVIIINSKRINGFEIGEFNLETNYGYTKVTGSIKNVSNKVCQSAEITFKFTSGSIVAKEKYATFHDIKSGEIYMVDTYADITNEYKGYKVSVESITCS